MLHNNVFNHISVYGLVPPIHTGCQGWINEAFKLVKHPLLHTVPTTNNIHVIIEICRIVITLRLLDLTSLYNYHERITIHIITCEHSKGYICICPIIYGSAHMCLYSSSGF